MVIHTKTECMHSNRLRRRRRREGRRRKEAADTDLEEKWITSYLVLIHSHIYKRIVANTRMWKMRKMWLTNFQNYN